MGIGGSFPESKAAAASLSGDEVFPYNKQIYCHATIHCWHLFKLATRGNCTRLQELSCDATYSGVHRRFRGTYFLYIEDPRYAKQVMSKKQEAPGGNPCSFPTLCIFNLENGSSKLNRNAGLPDYMTSRPRSQYSSHWSRWESSNPKFMRYWMNKQPILRLLRSLLFITHTKRNLYTDHVQR
jgi:hypothetical protein